MELNGILTCIVWSVEVGMHLGLGCRSLYVVSECLGFFLFPTAQSFEKEWEMNWIELILCIFFSFKWMETDCSLSSLKSMRYVRRALIGCREETEAVRDFGQFCRVKPSPPKKNCFSTEYTWSVSQSKTGNRGIYMAMPLWFSPIYCYYFCFNRYFTPLL